LEKLAVLDKVMRGEYLLQNSFCFQLTIAVGKDIEKLESLFDSTRVLEEIGT
jgi:hypothetical protein